MNALKFNRPVAALLASLSLRTVLIACFTALAVGVGGTAGMLSYQAGRQAVTTLARQLLDEIGDRINQRLSYYFSAPESIVQSNAALIRQGRFDLSDSTALQRHFALQLGLFNGVDSIGLVTEQREMLMLAQYAPEALILRRFNASTHDRLQHFRADREGQPQAWIESRQNYDPHNDPPDQPWYPAVRNAGQGVWRLSVSLAKGQDHSFLVSFYARPFQDAAGATQGVLFAGMTLTDTSQFLQGLNVSPAGQAFLIDHQGRLVATSTGETPFDSRPRRDHAQNVAVETRRLSAIDSLDPLTRQTVRQLQGHEPSLERITTAQRFDFIFNGQQYFARVAPLQERSQPNWLTVVVAPEGDFAALMTPYLQRASLMGGLTLVTAVLLGLLAAGWISRPLLQSEAKFRCLFEQSPLGIALFDARTGCLLEMNERLAQILGRTREELMTVGWMAVTHADDLQAEWDQVMRLLTGEIIGFQMEKRYLRPDGSVIWVDLTVAQVTVPGEANRLHLSLIEDITARKSAEAQVQASERKMRNILDNIPMALAVSTLEANPRVTYLNEQFTQTFGYTPEDLPTVEEWFSRAYPDDQYRATVREVWNAAMTVAIAQQGRIESMEFRVTDKDGAVREILISATVLDDVLLCAFIDITERKHAEEALRDSEEKFRLAFNNANTGMCLVDLQGRLLQVNDKMSGIFGYSRRELERMTVNDLALPDDVELSPKFIQQAAAGMVDSLIFEKRYRHQQGHTLYGQVASSLVRNAQGQPRYFISQVQDITERKQAEERAEQANRAKSEFMAQMTHELRTPLHAILGFAQILEHMEDRVGDRDREADYRRQLLTTLRRNGYHLLALVNDVLDLSRIEHGRLTLKARPTNLHTLLRNSVANLAPLAEAKGLALHLALDAGLPAAIQVDAQRLNQILTNLLGNAVKFTAQGEIRVQAGAIPDPRHPEQVALRITVADTGPGITAADQARIFAAFVQVVPSVGGSQGAGLGLAISRQLAQQMGGGMSLDSTPGFGSRFTLTLPVVVLAEGYDCGEDAAAAEAEAGLERFSETPLLESVVTDALPPAAALQELRELADLGRTTRIEVWCQHWSAPERRPAFAARILQLAHAFENDRIVDLADAGLASFSHDQDAIVAAEPPP